ncbi:MAG TPA: hypothetical protein VG204_09860 [Terriglobia bacterium]|nr:hypothetical protein [Terriglobia bacterium]
MAKNRICVVLVLCVLGILAAVPAFGGSTVVGAAVAGKNASIGGESLIPGYTIFSGDNLKVADGAAVVTVGNGSRMVFGHDTAASFERQSNEVSALLSHGNVSVYHPVDDVTALNLKVGNLSIVMAPGFKTLGEVAMAGTTLVVATKDGLMRVNSTSGQTVEVPKGKTVKFQARTQAPQQAGGAQRYGSDKGLIFDIIAAGGAIAAVVIAAYAHEDAHDSITAANQADADAKAALAAAQAATAAANQANQNAIDVGCTLNNLFAGAPPASLFTPVGGTCPTP